MQSIPAGRTVRVVDEIESWGGDANAMTTRDHVVLHARVPTTDAAAALGVLVAAATTRQFDEDLVAAERRVVLEELRLAACDPTDIVHDVFFQAAYGDHPMGRPVGGTAAGVAGLHAADLAAWSSRFVRPALLRVVVCGGMTSDSLRTVVDSSQLGTLTGSGRRPDSSPPVTAGRRDLSIVSDTAGVVVGGAGFALSDPAILAAEVVLELIAGGNASVLTEEIRSRRGLSYDVSGGASGYRETGSWRVAISTAPEHREQVVELTTGMLTDAIRYGWKPDQVRSASRRLAGLARVQTESSLEEALLFGDRAYVGESAGFSLDGYLARIAAVTADEVNEAAEFMFARLVVATAGGE